MEFLKHILSPNNFMPHGYCYLWNPPLVWLHVVSDALIFLSYLSIPFTLIYFIRRRRDLSSYWVFGFFGLFIVACGFTHLMEIWTLWHASYWLSGAIKAVTAFVSVATAVILAQLVPIALALPSPAALSHEIAERELAQQKMRELNGDLERRAAELEAANKELEAFTYSVSHDLRAPLRHIDGFSKLLLEEHSPELSEEAREYLSFVRDGTREMNQLVDDLLNLTRVGRKELSLQVTGLNALVAEVMSALKAENAERAIEWKIESLPFVECDPSLMKQVFINLLSNAVKFTRLRQPAIIEVGSVRQGDNDVIFVRDNGVGFDMKHVGKLFGVFQRLHRQEDFEGTGIGLAIVQRIIRKHRGRVWAEAELNKGAAFYFTLGVPEESGPKIQAEGGA